MDVTVYDGDIDVAISQPGLMSARANMSAPSTLATSTQREITAIQTTAKLFEEKKGQILNFYIFNENQSRNPEDRLAKASIRI